MRVTTGQASACGRRQEAGRRAELLQGAHWPLTVAPGGRSLPRVSALLHYPEVDSYPATSGRMCPPCPSVSLSSLLEIPLRRLHCTGRGNWGPEKERALPAATQQCGGRSRTSACQLLPPHNPAPGPSSTTPRSPRHPQHSLCVRCATPGPDSPSLLNPHHFF